MHFRPQNTGRKAYRLIELSIATVVFFADTGSALVFPGTGTVCGVAQFRTALSEIEAMVNPPCRP